MASVAPAPGERPQHERDDVEAADDHADLPLRAADLVDVRGEHREQVEEAREEADGAEQRQSEVERPEAGPGRLAHPTIVRPRPRTGCEGPTAALACIIGSPPGRARRLAPAHHTGDTVSRAAPRARGRASAVPNATDEYRNKLRTPDEAVALIPDGAFVFKGNCAGEPPALVRALADRARDGGFTNLRTTSLLPMGAASESILAPDVRDVIRWESLFVNGVDRGLIGSGVAHYNPNFFHQVPRLILEFMDIDVALIDVSRVDRHGYMSLGTNVDTHKAAIEKADIVIAEVNNHMPRVHGNSWVHVSELDAIVEHDEPLPELPLVPERPEDEAMGQLIAEMVPDGATIQLGIGGVPNALARALMGHRNLGIHTEMFVDSMVDLIESGVADGSQKTFHPGKAVYAFAAGARRTYEFLDDNPGIEAHPVSYTNFPPNIARNENMISVNSTIEVDL
ncbi:MAG: hypothetical protein F4X80_11350, partial [Chloroflexi bacterium]|nr:hypothetical protein [Chloroflexota bacterium]